MPYVLITINSATRYSVMRRIVQQNAATECNVMPPSIGSKAEADQSPLRARGVHGGKFELADNPVLRDRYLSVASVRLRR